MTSNPYTGSPSYWTTTAFDALGRPTSVTLPDGSATTYSPYSAQYTTVSDPAGKKRKSQADGAGRLVSLTEPDTSGNLVNTTYYTYNVLDELTGVADALTNPTQTRTFTYDSLGRPFTTKTPEGGTTCFGTVSSGSCTANTGYDNFNNLLYRTDARGVVTSYTYDGLNRLKGVVYTVVAGVPSTASLSFTYGTSASQFNNGALITMTDGVGSENYSYNALEQLTQLQKIINGTPSTTYYTSYGYNVAGELTQITYPSGRVVQQSVDPIGRLCEIAPSSPTGCGSAASPYATGYTYNVADQLTGFKYGNGLYASLGFSSDRLQLSCLDYSTTNRGQTCAHDSTTKFGLSYSYGSAGSNNGLIAGITDSVDNGRTVAYTYDPLSRLSTALTTGSTNYPQWGLSWGYDRYGNRLNQTQTAGSVYQGTVQVTASSNRINCIGGSGQSCTGGVVPTYDANGNMTYDGTNTLVYDAENHAVSATNQSSAGAYVYDGNGLRVQKCVPICTTASTVYVFSGSKVIAEYDNGAVPTAPSREYIYGGGVLLAKIDSTGTKYYHQDHLSNRLVTSSTGATLAQMGHFPFGDPWYNGTNEKLFFTSYERDTESSNDYAQARFYRWLLGRFFSLDPLSGSTSDPQSLNRYAYVDNNPVSLSDPSGMSSCGDFTGKTFFECISQLSQQSLEFCDSAGAGIVIPCGLGIGWDEFSLLTGSFLVGLAFNFDIVADPEIKGDATLVGEVYPIYGGILFQTGPGGGGPRGIGDVDQKRLADCVKNIYKIKMTNFAQSAPGSNGTFTGIDLKGNIVSVENDVGSYNLSAIKILSKGVSATGFTSDLYPFSANVNYTASDLATAKGFGPEYIPEAQVHELGHSLDLLTSWIPFFGTSEKSADAFENCVSGYKKSRH